MLDGQAAEWNRCDVARAMDLYWRSPQLEMAEEFGRDCHNVIRFRFPEQHLTSGGDTASVSGGRMDVTTAAGAPQTHAFTMTMRCFPGAEWKIVREGFSSVAVEDPSPYPAGSRLERLFAGAAALVVPSPR